ncbi:Similar to Perlucin (Haliotis laevigata) [Cotesia congregata]|uniref:Similar to Perlucin (Haliotis laevigata) n=1 Tax=Cotesia congregata TaxID=51543 RepID=A0A8J2MV27_COTCN|nr:Similar to Perlucin (Haliotis laevigata) [Cotesia congregata]
MWKCWILLLCSTGLSLSSSAVGPQSVSINLPENNHVKNEVKKELSVRRFACPIGFFRLKRNCYYLSAGMAPWREAHFHCKDRNSTLAILDKKGKNRILRKYLMGDQFTKLERWIGGIYNWQQMTWEWGVSGEKVVFQNFHNLNQSNSKAYAWHCIVLDPAIKYKWSPRSCVKKKHYICQLKLKLNFHVLGHRRKKIKDNNLVEQNQITKPKRKERKGSRSRHPRPADRTRHQLNRIRQRDDTPKITQRIPQGYEHGAFLRDGSIDTNPQFLADSQYHNSFNDIAHEEVLIKT